MGLWPSPWRLAGDERHGLARASGHLVGQSVLKFAPGGSRRGNAHVFYCNQEKMWGGPTDRTRSYCCAAEQKIGILVGMFDHKSLEAYVLSMPNAFLDYPFGEEVAVYKVPVGDEAKMFALIPEGKDPLQISLKCDPQLAELLRGKYESVLPGYHLNKKHWNTVILSGQLPQDEVEGLIVHSYNLVAGL